MIKVGLTGGIGTGKSVIARAFAELQVPVYSGDKGAKKAYADKNVLERIKRSFGEDVFQNGTVNFKSIAAIVFNDKARLLELNAIIHPFLFKDFNAWADNYEHVPYIIMEAAILYETKYHQLFDKIITVSAPEELCIERVTKRDGYSREEVQNRIRSQVPDQIKATRADFVILNDGKSLVLPQVLDIHKKLLKPN